MQPLLPESVTEEDPNTAAKETVTTSKRGRKRGKGKARQLKGMEIMLMMKCPELQDSHQVVHLRESILQEKGEGRTENIKTQIHQQVKKSGQLTVSEFQTA